MKIHTTPSLKYGLLFAVMLLAMPYVFAQPPDLTEVESQVGTAAQQVKNIVNIILGAVVLIGSIGTIYAFVSNNPNKKEWAIGLFVAIIIWIIVMAVV